MGGASDGVVGRRPGNDGHGQVLSTKIMESDYEGHLISSTSTYRWVRFSENVSFSKLNAFISPDVRCERTHPLAEPAGWIGIVQQFVEDRLNASYRSPNGYGVELEKTRSPPQSEHWCVQPRSMGSQSAAGYGSPLPD
jgi:hypothetical protein